MKLSTKQTLLVVLLLLLFVMVGYYFLFDLIKSKNQKVSIFSQEIDLYLERESMRRTTEKTAEELSEKIQKLDSYFLHKDEVVPFIESIENAGGKSGVVVDIVSVDVTNDPTVNNSDRKDEMMDLRLSVKGSWGNVINFISYVENLPYKVDVSNVVFRRDSAIAPFFGVGEAASKVGGDSGVPEWSAAIQMGVLTLK